MTPTEREDIRKALIHQMQQIYNREMQKKRSKRSSRNKNKNNNITLLSQEQYVKRNKMDPDCSWLLKEIDNFFNEINWSNIAKKYLIGRNASDVLLSWYKDINPNINRKKFSQQERELLFDIANENDYFNWNTIAQEFKKASDETSQEKNKKKKKEKKSLMDDDNDGDNDDEQSYFELDKIDSKNNININNSYRTSLQCLREWTQYDYKMENDEMMCPWSRKEDLKLSLLICRFGTKSVKYISTFFKQPLRTADQCATRWNKTLACNVQCGAWNIYQDIACSLAHTVYACEIMNIENNENGTNGTNGKNDKIDENGENGENIEKIENMNDGNGKNVKDDVEVRKSRRGKAAKKVCKTKKEKKKKKRVNKIGRFGVWTLIAKHIEYRSDVQARERHRNRLNQSRKEMQTCHFSSDEDRLIMQLYKQYEHDTRKWSKICKHLSGNHSSGQVRNRYKSLQKFGQRIRRFRNHKEPNNETSHSDDEDEDDNNENNNKAMNSNMNMVAHGSVNENVRNGSVILIASNVNINHSINENDDENGNGRSNINDNVPPRKRQRISSFDNDSTNINERIEGNNIPHSLNSNLNSNINMNENITDINMNEKFLTKMEQRQDINVDTQEIDVDIHTYKYDKIKNDKNCNWYDYDRLKNENFNDNLHHDDEFAKLNRNNDDSDFDTNLENFLEEMVYHPQQKRLQPSQSSLSTVGHMVEQL